MQKLYTAGIDHTVVAYTGDRGNSEAGPGSLTASLGVNQQIVLAWSAVPQATQYALTCSGGAECGQGGHVLYVGDATSFIASGLTNGVPYTFMLSIKTPHGTHSGLTVSAAPSTVPAVVQGVDKCGIQSSGRYVGGVYAKTGGGKFDFGSKGHYVGVTACGSSDYLSYDGHAGIDYAVKLFTPVYPAITGTVSYNENDGGDVTAKDKGVRYHSLTITSSDQPNLRVHYLHLSSYYDVATQKVVRVTKFDKKCNVVEVQECPTCAQPGTVVKKDRTDPIGYVGNFQGQWCGVGPHLHFGVTIADKAVDPYGWQGAGPDPYTRATNANLWEALASAPTITSISPSRPIAGISNLRITVRGAQFQCPAPAAQFPGCLKVDVFAAAGIVGTLNAPGQIQSVLSDGSAFDMLATFGSAGSYSMVITNPSGSKSAPFQFSVQPPPNPELLFNDGSTLAVFGPPIIDSTGALYVARTEFGFGCGFGFCDMKLQKIVPGTPGWASAPLGDALDPGTILVGADDQVYFQGQRNSIYKFQSDGTAAPGAWPVEIAPFFNNIVHNVFTDDPSGDVFAMAATFGSCFDSCFQYFKALKSTGEPLWSITGPASGTQYLLGPGRKIYALSPSSFARYDRDTGGAAVPGGDPIPECQTAVDHGFNSVVADLMAVYSSIGTTVTAFDSGCAARTFLEGVGRTNLTLRGVNVGMVLITDQPVDNTSPDQNSRLIAIANDGSRTWRNREFVPYFVSSDNPVKAVYGSTVYVLGYEFDPNQRWLYGIDALTGEIRSKIDLHNICSTCGFAVDRNGNVYVNDLNSTKIFRVPNPF